MASARPDVRQKAICNFYHICMKYPDALRPGFPALKARLEDSDVSVVFTTLNVMAEFCKLNPSNFVSLIPKFHSMLSASPNNWCTLKLIYLLRMLCEVEPRLPKKLVNPFTNILETTSSITVLFECVRTIIEVPIQHMVLLTYATNRMQNFIEHQDANLRFLCLTLFIKLMEIQPKLVSQHKEIISNCLDSNDEATRILALDLLMSLANSKTVDGIVAKMFMHFKDSVSTSFKDRIIRSVIEICSKDDYHIVSDFEWYIQVIGDFIEEGGFTCYDLVADQFMDLATRVPDTRPALVKQMEAILAMRAYRDATKLLLCALYIIAEYSENSDSLPTILTPNILYCDERVQVSALSTAFKLYVRCESAAEFEAAEALFEEHLPGFETGLYAEVQDIAVMTMSLVNVLRQQREGDAFNELKARLTAEYDEDELPPLDVPEELDEPDAVFEPSDDGFSDDADAPAGRVDALVEEAAKAATERAKDKEKEKPARKIRHRKQEKTEGRANVVIKPSKKSLFDKKEKPKADPLQDAFASIDLSDLSGQERLPSPAPYGASRGLILPPREEKKKAAVLKSRRPARHGEEKGAEKKKGEPPVSEPQPRARLQKLVENDALAAEAVEFECSAAHPRQLTVELSVANKTGVEFSSVGVELANEAAAPVQMLPIAAIAPRKTGTGKVTIELAAIAKPTIVRLRFVPVSAAADVVEADLKIFPSMFLLPGSTSDVAECEGLEGSASFAMTLTHKPRELLQRLVNILRGPVLPQAEKTAKLVVARTTEGAAVAARLSLDGDSATVEVSAADQGYAEIICREIKIKTAALAK